MGQFYSIKVNKNHWSIISKTSNLLYMHLSKVLRQFDVALTFISLQSSNVSIRRKQMFFFVNEIERFGEKQNTLKVKLIIILFFLFLGRGRPIFIEKLFKDRQQNKTKGLIIQKRFQLYLFPFFLFELFLGGNNGPLLIFTQIIIKN